MKKLLSFLIASTVFISYAQLSGNYTIGGDNPDYNNLQDVANDLTNKGISGETHFKFRSGVYEDQLSLSDFSGSSSNNIVYFESETGNKKDVTLKFTSSKLNNNNYVVNLFGSSYVTFRNLSFEAKGTEGGRVFNIWNGTTNITIENCYLESAQVPDNYGPKYAVIHSDWALSPLVDSSIVIKNNTLKYGSYGIYMKAPSTGNLEKKTLIENNTVLESSNYGIYITYQSGVIVQNNLIESNVASTGIRLNNCNGSSIVKANKVILTKNGSSMKGLYFNSCKSTPNKPYRVTNNMVSLLSGLNSYGMYLTSSNFIQLVHNSVYLVSEDASSYALRVVSSNDSVSIINNIFAANNGAASAYFQNIEESIQTADYNNYYANGSDKVVIFNGLLSSLKAWQESEYGFGKSSVNVFHNFKSTTNLSSCSAELYRKGVHISWVESDFDGNLRASPPMIGASELTSETPKAIIENINDSLISSSGNTYKWLKNNDTIVGETNKFHLPKTNGDYQVILTNIDGCSDTSNVYKHIATGINNISDEIIPNIYPNPTTDYIHINTANISEMHIISVLGIHIKSIINPKLNLLNASDLKKGNYLLKIVNKNQKITILKFVKI